MGRHVVLISPSFLLPPPSDLHRPRIGHPSATPRQGIALPIALAAIVAIGALIAGVFFASTQEYRVGRNTLTAQRAFQGAEVGLSSVVSNWVWTDRVKVGRTKAFADTTVDGTTVTRQITRVSPTIFWVTSYATAGGQSADGRAQKRLNAVVRIETPDFKIMGAITSRGTTGVAGSTKISGSDTVPSGWDCPPGGAQAAGIVVNDSATNYSASGVNYSINGTPKVKDSTDMVRDTMNFTNFGGFSYDSLAKLANKVRIGGGTINSANPRHSSPGVCDIGHNDNWGDTSHVNGPRGCEQHFPVVHLKGPTSSYTLDGNSGGQGILLADGNLTVAGTFRWSGIILVRGTFSLAGTGAGGGVKIVGAVAAMNRSNGSNSISGNSTVTFSRCVINQITSKRSTAAVMKHRSWADMSF